jgi:hypothetical protein
MKHQPKDRDRNIDMPSSDSVSDRDLRRGERETRSGETSRGGERQIEREPDEKIPSRDDRGRL